MRFKELSKLLLLEKVLKSKTTDFQGHPLTIELVEVNGSYQVHIRSNVDPYLKGFVSYDSKREGEDAFDSLRDVSSIVSYLKYCCPRYRTAYPLYPFYNLGFGLFRVKTPPPKEPMPPEEEMPPMDMEEPPTPPPAPPTPPPVSPPTPPPPPPPEEEPPPTP